MAEYKSLYIDRTMKTTIPPGKFEKIDTRSPLEKEIEERSKRMNDMLRWCKHEKQKIGELIRKAKAK